MYFRLSDDELILAAQIEDPQIDPRLYAEARRRGLYPRVMMALAKQATDGSTCPACGSNWSRKVYNVDACKTCLDAYEAQW